LLVAGGTVVLALLLFYAYRANTVVEIVRRLSGFLPGRFRVRLLRQIEVGSTGLHALRDGRLVLQLLATSLVQWLLMWACVSLSLQAVGIHVAAVVPFMILVLIMVGTSLPNSPGFVGSIQLAYALALRPLGVDPAAAIAASVFFHVLTYTSVVLVGATFMQRIGLNREQLREAIQRAS